MTFPVTLLIALGLALDAFSVAIAIGVSIQKPRLDQGFLIAGFFGIFQATMPLAGWTAGVLLVDYITHFDHWIAFLLLGLIGSHMIYESFRSGSGQTAYDPLSIHVLLLLSVATSIDALVVGISFALIHVRIIQTALIIGIVTFLLSFAGYFIGKNVKDLFGNKVRILGGIILIGIGFKILIEHLR
jgi:putative Mn2+ efflux pump MntP